MSITEKKYKPMKMEVNTYYLELIFILLNILQQQKLMKKVILTETLNLKKKDKRHQKKCVIRIIRINTSRENYDADYEASRLQTLISQFKENTIKEKDNKMKELEEEIKKLKLQLTNQSTQYKRNNDDSDKK